VRRRRRRRRRDAQNKIGGTEQGSRLRARVATGEEEKIGFKCSA